MVTFLFSRLMCASRVTSANVNSKTYLEEKVEAVAVIFHAARVFTGGVVIQFKDIFERKV